MKISLPIKLGWDTLLQKQEQQNKAFRLNYTFPHHLTLKITKGFLGTPQNREKYQWARNKYIFHDHKSSELKVRLHILSDQVLKHLCWSVEKVLCKS